MLKHIGRQGQENVVVVFREVPGEEHMCLVVYPRQLPSSYHDDLMKCIESNAGQSASNLGEAMHRVVGTDGRNLLGAVHAERWMKKIQTQAVIMTPVPNSPGARLDEINKIIKDMESGSDAAKRMAQIDAQSGLADPANKIDTTAYAAAANAATPGVLTDAVIAQNLITQAESMRAQIAGLEAEATRLMEEATQLNPSLNAASKKRGRKKAAA